VGHFTDALWQKSHLRFMITTRGSWDTPRMFLNLIFFSQLRARCDSQPYSCDTATFVHTQSSEAV